MNDTAVPADFVVFPPATGWPRTLATPVYDHRRDGESLADAIRRHIPDLATQGAGRLRLWFADDFSAYGLEQNEQANTIIARLGYHHPYGWFGPVAVSMEEDRNGEIAPLPDSVRETIDELGARA